MKNALTYILLIIASLGQPVLASNSVGVSSYNVEIVSTKIHFHNSQLLGVKQHTFSSPKTKLAYSLNADTHRVVAQQQHDDLRNWTHTSWLNVKNYSSSLGQSI